MIRDMDAQEVTDAYTELEAKCLARIEDLETGLLAKIHQSEHDIWERLDSRVDNNLRAVLQRIAADGEAQKAILEGLRSEFRSHHEFEAEISMLKTDFRAVQATLHEVTDLFQSEDGAIAARARSAVIGELELLRAQQRDDIAVVASKAERTRVSMSMIESSVADLRKELDSLGGTEMEEGIKDSDGRVQWRLEALEQTVLETERAFSTFPEDRVALAKRVDELEISAQSSDALLGRLEDVEGHVKAALERLELASLTSSIDELRSDVGSLSQGLVVERNERCSMMPRFEQLTESVLNAVARSIERVEQRFVEELDEDVRARAYLTAQVQDGEAEEMEPRLKYELIRHVGKVISTLREEMCEEAQAGGVRSEFQWMAGNVGQLADSRSKNPLLSELQGNLPPVKLCDGEGKEPDLASPPERTERSDSRGGLFPSLTPRSQRPQSRSSVTGLASATRSASARSAFKPSSHSVAGRPARVHKDSHLADSLEGLICAAKRTLGSAQEHVAQKHEDVHVQASSYRPEFEAPLVAVPAISTTASTGQIIQGCSTTHCMRRMSSMPLSPRSSPVVNLQRSLSPVCLKQVPQSPLTAVSLTAPGHPRALGVAVNATRSMTIASPGASLVTTAAIAPTATPRKQARGTLKVGSTP